jgi:cytochrome c oxidase cbb3-type subunit 4
VDIDTFSAYAYFCLTVFLVFMLYGYIYHLYTKKKSADGVDYEEYANMALNDDIVDTPVVSAKSEDKEK